MQATFFGGQGILPEMPAALHLGSGILGERRMFNGDGSAAVRSGVFIFIFVFCRHFLQMTVRPNL